MKGSVNIAHINYMPESIIGIDKKLGDQARAAVDAGLNVDFYVLNSAGTEDRGNLKLVKLKTSPNKVISSVQKKLFRFYLIHKSVELKKYDRIVLRYTSTDLSTLWFVWKYGKKLFTEHHSNEVGEAVSRNTGLAVKIKLFFERYVAPLFLKRVKGIIAVTDEIGRFEQARSGNENIAVVSNGIDAGSVRQLVPVRFDGTKITMISVATRYVPWQGLYRVLDGLMEYAGDLNVEFFAIGTVQPDDMEKIKKINAEKSRIRILTPGCLSGDVLDGFFEKSHIAVSSLALFEKGMEEACSLKTREYMARGIPFIYGYKDSDLDGSESFAMKISADRTPLNINDVICFLRGIPDIAEISEQMRAFSREKLDWKIKVMQMYEFVAKEI